MKRNKFIESILPFFVLILTFIPFIHSPSSNHLRKWNDLALYNQPKNKFELRISASSSNHPEDFITTILGLETIAWILWDDVGSGKYRVWANDTNNNYYVWQNWTDWTNNTNLKVPINRTAMGIFNYTIEYNNSGGQFGTPDMVIIEIVPNAGSWTITEVISTESTSFSTDSAITIDSFGNLHLVWQDDMNYLGSGTDYDIFYKRWNATTGIWNGTINDTDVISIESTGESYNPTIAVDSSGNVNVAWHDNTNYTGSGTDYDIFYKQWNATLGIWMAAEVVSTESTDASIYPTIAVDDLGNVHIAWYDWTDFGYSGSDSDIFYKCRNATTGIWNGAINDTDVISTESTDNSYFPSIGIDSSNNIHIAWHDYTNYTGSGLDHDIFYKLWNATTRNWTLTEVISTESTGNSWNPTMAIDNSNNVHLVWQDYSGADVDIFYKHWNATTGVWTISEVVSTESTDDSYTPTIIVDDFGNVHVVWDDRTNYTDSGTDADIFYKYWFAARGIWTTTEVISTESWDVSYSPTISVNNVGNIYVLWDDSTNYNNSGSDSDIFFKLKSLSPTSNHPEDIITTTSGSETIGWIVWDEISPGKYRIWANDTNGNFYVWRDWTDWANYKNLQVPINRSSTGVFNYTIEYNNSRGLFGTPDMVIIGLQNLTSNHPEDITTSIMGSETIDWFLYSEVGSGKYRVWANDTNGNYYVWQDWIDWDNNTNLQVPINRTFMGIYNYTIEYNNSMGYFGTPDMVIITVTYWNITEVISTECTYNSTLPAIAVDDSGNVHVAWGDYSDYGGSGTDADIFYKHWNATTGNWATTEVVSIGFLNNSHYPTISADSSGNVHVSWTDISDYRGSGTDPDIFYKYWNATTGIWSGHVNETDLVSTESNDDAIISEITVDGSSNVHVTWYEVTDYGGSGSDSDIFYKCWNATTGNWTTTEVVSTESTNHSLRPKIAVDDSGNLHFVWFDLITGAMGQERRVYYKRWNATTDNWTTTELISPESMNYSWAPVIAIDISGNVHVAWFDNSDYGGSGMDSDIFYKCWNTTMGNWTTTEVVSTESTSESWAPTITVDISGNVHVAWFDYSDYASSGMDVDIFYKCWDANMAIWTLTEVVSTESTSNSFDPRIAVDGSGNVHMTWSDYSDYKDSGVDIDVFYKLKFFMAPKTILSYSKASPNLVNNFTNFYLSAIDVTGYGVAETYYRINLSIWTNYTSPFNLSGYEDGNYLIQYYSVDNVGNEEMIKSEIVYLDITKPPILTVIIPTKVKPGNIITFRIDSDSPNYDVKITIDDNKTVEEFMTDLGDGSYIFNWNTTELPPGVYNIIINLTDSVGNTQIYQTSIKITSPVTNPLFLIPSPDNTYIIIIIILGIVGAAICGANVVIIRKKRKVDIHIVEDLQREVEESKRLYYEERKIIKEEIEPKLELKPSLKIESIKKDLLHKVFRAEYLGVSDITITLILKNLINSQISLDSIKDERILDFFKQDFNILSKNEINRVLQLDIPNISDKLAILEELVCFLPEEREEFLKYLEEIEER